MVGCPAIGSSRRGVKIRTRALVSGWSGGNTKVVSGNAISADTCCITRGGMSAASGKTASGLPARARRVNTST